MTTPQQGGVNLGSAYGSITINDNIDAAINDATRKFDNALTAIGGRMEQLGSQMSNVGVQISFISAPLGLLGRSFSNAGREFETAFTGIEKTFQGTAEELEVLQNRIEEMAASPDKLTSQLDNADVALSRIGELAGQLGIQGVDNIAKFTETIALLRITTDLVGDEATLALAQFSNIMQTPTENVDRLGSVIVDLGNNLATTESKILEMGQRIAGAGNIVGLTEREVLALAGSLSSVGIEAEAGGTAISRVLLDINAFVAQSSEELNTIASAMGMSAEEFSTAWGDEPIEALNDFIGVLRQMEKDGGNTVAFLEELGFADIRVRDTLLRLATGEDMLTGAITTANNAWEENIALTEEASRRADTTDSIIALGLNNWDALQRAIGEHLNAALRDFVRLMIPVLQNITAWVKENPELVRQILKILGVVTVLGPALVILGQVIAFIGGGLSGLGLLLGALMSPIGLVIAGISFLAYAFRDSLGGALNFVQNLFEAISRTIRFFVSDIGNFGLEEAFLGIFGKGSIAETMESTLEGALTIMGVSRDRAIEIVNAIWNAIEPFYEAIQNVFTAFGTGFRTFNTSLESGYTILESLGFAIETFFGSLGVSGQVIAGVRSVFVRLFDFLENSWDVIRGVLAGFAEHVRGIWAAFQEGGLSGVGTYIHDNIFIPLLNSIQSIDWGAVGTAILNAIGSFLKFNFNSWTWILENFTLPFWGSVISSVASVDWGAVGSAILSALGTALTTLGTWATWAYDNILVPLFDNAKSAIENFDWFGLGEGLMNAIGSALLLAFDFVTWIVNMIFNPLADNAEGATDGVDWGAIGNAIMGAIGAFFTGVFDFIWWVGEHIILPFIEGAVSAVQNADWSSIGQHIMDAIAETLPNIETWVQNNIIRPIRNALSAFNPMSSVDTGGGNFGVSLPNPALTTINPTLGALQQFGRMFGGSFASGIDYLPRDALIMAHEGEAIIPKAQNPAAGGGGILGGMDFAGAVFNFYGNTESEGRAMARGFKAELDELMRSN